MRRIYTPATEDLWFKFMLGSDGGNISSAFIETAIALSFRHVSTKFLTDRAIQLEKKGGVLFPSRPEDKRRVATDFAYALEFKESEKEIGSKIQKIQKEKEIIEKNIKEAIVDNTASLKDIGNSNLRTRDQHNKDISVLESLVQESIYLGNEYAILCDSIKRGVILSSEM